MQPRSHGTPQQASRMVLAIGLALSLVMVVPSVRYSARVYLPGHLAGHIGFNLILLAAVSSPFLVIYMVMRNRAAVLTLTFGTVFSVLHLYPIYTAYALPPQEFGYLGLAFVPILEALIGVPVSLGILLVLQRRQRA